MAVEVVVYALDRDEGWKTTFIFLYQVHHKGFITFSSAIVRRNERSRGRGKTRVGIGF